MVPEFYCAENWNKKHSRIPDLRNQFVVLVKMGYKPSELHVVHYTTGRQVQPKSWGDECSDG